MELVHDDLTQIEDGLPKVDGFIHNNSDLPHLAPYQVLTEDDSQFKVWLHHILEICLLVGCELDVPVFSDVFHGLPYTELLMSLKKSVSKLFLALVQSWVLNSMHDTDHEL